MNQKRIKIILLLFFIIFMILFCKSCHNTLNNAEQEIYTLPNETNTTIVQCDILCWPTLYKKTWFGKKKIWDCPNSRFMETVHFGVEWLSGDEIWLSYADVRHSEYNEEHIIMIP